MYSSHDRPRKTLEQMGYTEQWVFANKADILQVACAYIESGLASDQTIEELIEKSALVILELRRRSGSLPRTIDTVGKANY